MRWESMKGQFAVIEAVASAAMVTASLGILLYAVNYYSRTIAYGTLQLRADTAFYDIVHAIYADGGSWQCLANVGCASNISSEYGRIYGINITISDGLPKQHAGQTSPVCMFYGNVVSNEALACVSIRG